MKLTTTTQVSVDGVMQGNGGRHPTDLDARRRGVEGLQPEGREVRPFL